MLMFAGTLFDYHARFSLNVRDTYFIIEQSHLFWLLGFAMLSFFILYWVLAKLKFRLNRTLTKLQVYGTLLGVLGSAFPYEFVFRVSSPRQIDNAAETDFFIAVSLFLFFLMQVVFIINIFVTIIKNSITKAGR